MDPMDDPNFISIPPNGNASTRPPVEYPDFILNPLNGNASTRPPVEYPHFILTPQHENLNTHELPRPNNIPNPIQAIIPQQPPETERNYYPCGDLLNAAITGDWEAALHILSIRPFLVSYCINENWETPLHVANKQGNTALCLAAAAGNVQVAKIMVEKNPQLLVIDSPSQEIGTPSFFPPLLFQDLKPLFFASLFGKRDMVTYLYDKSQELAGRYVTYDGWGWIILKCIEAELYDVALNILEYHEYALSQFECESYALQDLARKPCAFDDIKPYAILGIIKSGNLINWALLFHVKVGPTIKESEATYLLRKFWRKVVEKPRDYIDNLLKGPKIVLEKPKDNTGDMPQEVEIEKEEVHISPSQIVGDMPQEVEIEKEEVHIYPSQILSVAAEMGNTKFVVELIREYPDLIWKTNDLGQTIFHIAVSHRREGIYSLLHEIGSLKDLITIMRDIEGKNMLHLVGMNAEKNALEDVSGAAFQLQRELLWFKKNNAGKTPRQLFTGSHKDLVSLGEKWMKGTAN
ncbi:Ankyrin repeat-containing protein [Artemisia annua]|uniref:Ankyrin repeat-containing protein n=1 Tax=Artemisia annua TaxID=35608 RepID=A0A2U1MXJ8_ARTAN|nr:Ankyrin repeat-containing protein [Artemisia annua]